MDWKYKDGAIYNTNDAGELMAEATYAKTKDNEIDINHVYVNPVLRGEGVAGKVMEEMTVFLRNEGWKATASCSYANSWLKKHKDTHADIISDDFDSGDAACRIDGKH